MWGSLSGSARSLARHPGFVLTAAGTLALGIAATVSLFSAVNAVLLRPLPYPRYQDIYSVRTFFPSGRFTSGFVAVDEMRALGRITGVEQTAAARRIDGVMAVGAQVRQVVAYGASEHFFELFGVPVAMGRSFVHEDHLPGAPRVIILSHTLWQSAFGGRPDVIGVALVVASAPGRVIGVAPAGFDVPASADLWINIPLPASSIGHQFEGFARLNHAVTPDALRDPMKQAMDVLGKKYPDQDVGRAYALTPMMDVTVGDLGPILLILFGATALLLLLAAVNVSNLMLVRGTGRTREIAIRAALGASARRIVTQLIGESLIVSIVGGAVGVATGYVAVKMLVSFGGGRLPRLDQVPFDARVMVVSVLVIAVTGVLVGIAPAFRLARSDIASLMNESGRAVRGSRRSNMLLAGFIVAETAIAVALVAGAVRLVRSFDNIEQVDPGFRPAGQVLVEAVNADRKYFVQTQMYEWRRLVGEKLRAAGAADVAMTSSLPLMHEWDSTSFADLRSQPGTPPDQRPNGRVRFVTSDFFRAMGIKLIAGRPFTDADLSSPDHIAIVNEAFVQRFLPNSDPLRDALAGFSNDIVGGKVVRHDSAIVGVVANVRYASLTAPPDPIIYVPPSEYPLVRQAIVIAPAPGHPPSIPDYRAAILSVDPNVALTFSTMDEAIAGSVNRERLGMVLMAAFGFAAVLLAIVGVFGVVAYVVAQRSNEMAVRQALGATPGQVFRMVVGDGGRVALGGIAAGLLLSWWTGKMMGQYLYHVGAGDPLVLASSAAVVLIAAVCALLVPARRAASLDPAQALRNP